MEVEVKCSICGRKGKVNVDEKTGRILSGDWAYYGSVEFNGRKYECWECPECQKRCTVKSRMSKLSERNS